MRIIETKVYTIDEHPNKDLCFLNQKFTTEGWRGRIRTWETSLLFGVDIPKQILQVV